MGSTQSFLTEQDHRSKLQARSQYLRVRVSAEFYCRFVERWLGSRHLCTRVQALGVASDHIAIEPYQGAPDYARQLHSATLTFRFTGPNNIDT